jgi:hypothetical protein
MREPWRDNGGHRFGRGANESGGAGPAMKIDIGKLSEALAADPDVTDYDFWRALQRIDDELFRIERDGRAIPMRMLQQRSIIKRARQKRSPGAMES